MEMPEKIRKTNRQEGGSLRVSPAMAAGVVNRLMDIADFLAMLEEFGKRA